LVISGDLRIGRQPIRAARPEGYDSDTAAMDRRPFPPAPFGFRLGVDKNRTLPAPRICCYSSAIRPSAATLSSCAGSNR
jgi:hypothetical protein